MGASPDPPYLFITYIVTSNPNLISVADGLVHIIVSFIFVSERYQINRELMQVYLEVRDKLNYPIVLAL